jgi:hypothetical protein
MRHLTTSQRRRKIFINYKFLFFYPYKRNLTTNQRRGKFCNKLPIFIFSKKQQMPSDDKSEAMKALFKFSKQRNEKQA